jgi:AraC-like DNA-binding protein
LSHALARNSWTAPGELCLKRTRAWCVERFSALSELISTPVLFARHKGLTAAMSLQARLPSTSEVPTEKRAELWRERVAEKLLRITWDVPNDQLFHAAMIPVLCAGDVEIAGIESGPCLLTNTEAHAREKQHRCSIHILTSGHRAVTRRAEGEVELRKTMGIVLDEGKYYRHRSDNDLMRALVLMLPKPRIVERVPDFERLIESPLDISSEPFRLLQSFLNLPSAGVELNVPELARVNADYVVDLIVMSLSGRADDVEALQRRTLPETRYRVILGEIERGLGDPKLSGKTIAARIGITERYLQQLMEMHGETFSHFVLRQRLDKAAALLVSKRNLRISEIAFLCGFSDLSYFNRSFKKRFAENPRAYRR